MKQLLLTFLFFLLPMMASADPVEIDGIYYNLEIIEKANIYRASVDRIPINYSGEVVIPETVEYDGITYSVTSIDGHAFEDCSLVTSVTIPNSVTSIGYSAFEGCSGLTSVYITNLEKWCNIIFDGNYSNPLIFAHHLFLDDVEIKDLAIPNSVTSIGDFAFQGCSGLTSVNIPNGVTFIGEWAFYGCSGLTSVNIGNSVTSIGAAAFENCSKLESVNIPKDVDKISALSFAGCSSLNSITIENGVTSIGNYAFEGCSSLSTVTIPNSVTNVDMGAFARCRSLLSINIPNSVISIGDSAFVDCDVLATIIISNSVKTIGNGAFAYCSSLTSVHISDLTAWCNINFGINYLNAHHLFLNDEEIKDLVIPNSVTSIGSSAFSGCSGLTSLSIPNSVTSIGNYAFSGCSGLTFVTIPNSVTSIGNETFAYCSSLTSVNIPNSMTSIGDYAFSGCSDLASVIIGYGVTSIGGGAFASCKDLEDVYCYAENVPNTNSDAFSNSFIDYATLHIPETAIDAYSTTSPWSGFGTFVALDGLSFHEFAAFNADENAEFAALGLSIDATSVYGGTVIGKTSNVTFKIGADDSYKSSSIGTIAVGGTHINGGIQGGTNPKDADGGIPATTLNAPVGGAFYLIDVAEDGFLYVFLNSSSNKAYTVFEDGEAIGYTFSSYWGRDKIPAGKGVYSYELNGTGKHNRLKAAGITSVLWAEQYIMGDAYDIANTPDAKGYGDSGLGVIKFQVSAGCKYIVNANTSKMIASGFYFDKTGDATVIVNVDDTYVTILDNGQIPGFHRMTINTTGNGTVGYNNASVKAGSRTYNVTNGSNLILTLSPSEGNSLGYVKVNDDDKTSEVNEGTLVIENVTENIIVDVLFLFDGDVASLTITDAGVATFCSDKDLDFSDVAGVKAYTGAGFNTSTGRLVLLEVTDVPARTGLLVKGAAGSYEIPSKASASIYANLLVGVTSATALSQTDGGYTNYILGKKSDVVGFYKVDGSGGDLPAGKAYLRIPTSAAGARTAIALDFSGDTSGIDDIGADSTQREAWFDLQGRRMEVAPVKAGLYIRNGKKFIVH